LAARLALPETEIPMVSLASSTAVAADHNCQQFSIARDSLRRLLPKRAPHAGIPLKDAACSREKIKIAPTAPVFCKLLTQRLARLSLWAGQAEIFSIERHRSTLGGKEPRPRPVCVSKGVTLGIPRLHEQGQAETGMLQTAVCDLFGIQLPILGAPMGGVAGPDLVAAVSEAGGLGILGHANLEPSEVRRQIRATLAATKKPFGIGLLFPTRTDRTEHDTTPRPLPTFLRKFVGTDGLADPPEQSYSHDLAEERLAIAIEQGVRVLALGLGAPPKVVQRAKASGMKVLALIGSRRAALEAETAGVDAIVAQGHEAGGHTGRTSTMVLVPQIVDAVRVPVIAAGGIADGRGVAAALVLGAAGVLVGTRLLATPEGQTSEAHKRRLVEMRDDETIVSRCYTGKPSRVIRNAFIDAWRGHEAEILPMPAQWERVAPLVIPAKQRGSIDVGNWPTGQCAVLIDAIAPAGEVVRKMADEAAKLLSNYPVKHPSQNAVTKDEGQT
jgi:NAD(P)H-dependent flavin oxidoreductase YrpB (nitropropane dioxygenase family)